MITIIDYPKHKPLNSELYPKEYAKIMKPEIIEFEKLDITNVDPNNPALLAMALRKLTAKRQEEILLKMRIDYAEQVMDHIEMQQDCLLMAYFQAPNKDWKFVYIEK